MQSTVKGVLNMKRSTTRGKGLEVPCQSKFKDKPCEYFTLAMHDLTKRQKFNSWNLWVDLTYSKPV